MDHRCDPSRRHALASSTGVRSHTSPKRGLKALAFLAVLGLLAALFAVASPVIGAQPSDTQGPTEPQGFGLTPSTGDTAQHFALDGEDNSLGGATKVASAALAPGAAKSGTNGLLIDANNSQGLVRWGANIVEPGATYASASFWVRIDGAATDESIDLLTIANAENSRNFDFFVTAGAGRFKWDIFREAQSEGRKVDMDRWYFVEVNVSFAGTTHWAQVFIDGEDWGTIESPGAVDSTVGSISLGSAVEKTHTQAYDDVSIHLGQSPQTWTGAGLDTVTLSWLPATDNQSGVREYEIWRNDRWYKWVEGDQTFFVDPEPEAGARYRIRAVDEALNNGAWSRTVEVPAARTFAEPSPDGVDPQLRPDVDDGAAPTPVPAETEAPTPTPSQLELIAQQDEAIVTTWVPRIQSAVLGLLSWW